MKVILVNGSPHEKGCTYTALKEIENTLNNQDIETEIFWLGNKPISGCLGCGSCLKTGKCFGCLLVLMDCRLSMALPII